MSNSEQYTPSDSAGSFLRFRALLNFYSKKIPRIYQTFLSLASGTKEFRPAMSFLNMLLELPKFLTKLHAINVHVLCDV